MGKKCTLLLIVLLLALIGLVPVVSMFVKSFFVNGELSFNNYQALFQSKRQWSLLSHSLILACTTTFITILLGLPLGVVFAKTDLPLRKFFIVLFVIPLVIPSYILAVAWFYFLGRDGILAGLLGADAGAVTSRFLFSFWGTLFVIVTTLLPIVIILTITYLRMVDPRLEEAGKLSAGWPVVLRRISIPIIMPGVCLAGLIVFILTLGEFGVPFSLRFEVFPIQSFIQFSAFYDFNAATAAAVPLGLITLIVLIVERIFLRKKTFRFRAVCPEEAGITVPLGRKKPHFFIGVSVLAFIFVVIPIVVLIIKSFSLSAYHEALVRCSGSVFRSVLYASIGATSLVAFGFFLGYLLERKALRFSFAADSLAIFLFALPGNVIGIGLISLWNTQATNFIYASAVIILFGYVAQYTAISERIMAATFSQMPHSMEEAAQIAGAGWFRRLFGVLVPQAKYGIVAAWLVGFVFCLKDLGVTMMVYPAAHDTLPVRIFTLMANSPEQVIAALCVVMIIIACLPLGVLTMVTKYMR